MEKIKWYCIVEVVDVETGEIIRKSQVERGTYVKLRSTIKTKIETFTQNGFIKSRGIRTVQWECEPNKQGKLEL